MTPKLIKYPFDETGRNPTNRVLGEPHDLSHLKNLKYRALVLNNGYFYTDGLVVRDSVGQELKQGIDYHVAFYNAEVGKATGLEACAVIVIDNPRVSDVVHIDAQMVGGDYTYLSTALRYVVHTLSRDTRSVQWENIRGKPADYRPTGHLHGWWELYGFDPYNEQAIRVIDGLHTADRKIVDGMRDNADGQYDALNSQLDSLIAWLEEHKGDFGNPHQVTKAQVGLGSVENLEIATEAQARSLGRHDLYVTPLRTAQGIDTGFGVGFRAHLSDLRNPHGVTPNQVNVYSQGDALSLLSLKLNRTATAVNSLRLDNLRYNQVYENLRANLPASAVDSGRFSTARLGAGTANAQYVLLGDGNWHSISSIFDRFKSESAAVYYIGYRGTDSSALSHIRSTYSNINAYPVGTVVLFFIESRQGHGTGNGNMQLTVRPLSMARRTASGWITS